MRNVNLAHWSLYLLGGYIGFEVSERTGSWLLAFPVVFVAVAALGLILQHQVFRRMEGQELRQTMVTIGLSVVLADIMLWIRGGQCCTILTPDLLSGPVELPVISALRGASGEVIWFKIPAVRIAILIGTIVIGVAMWLVLNRSRLGMLIRAGVDDREMLAASGVRIQYVFLAVFAFGAGLAGMGGIVFGTFQSLTPGEDTRFLLASLVVVIVGGMGSIPGAAIGAVIIGLSEQPGLVHAPTCTVVFTFLIMAVVLAFRPQGLRGAGRWMAVTDQARVEPGRWNLVEPVHPTGWAVGFVLLVPPLLFGVDWRQPAAFCYLALGCAVLTCAAVVYVARSRFGLALQGVRDNPRRMAALGYSVNAQSIAACTFASVIAAVGGILLVWQNAQISPGTAGIPAVIDILVIAVVGGVKRPIGPFIGALIYVILRTFSPDVLTAFGLSGERFKLLIGMGFLVVVLFSPDGVLGLWEKWQARKPRDPLKGGGCCWPRAARRIVRGRYRPATRWNCAA